MKKISMLIISFVTISIVFYGFFSLVVKNISWYLFELSEQVEIVAFLDDKLSDNQKNELIKKIEGIQFVDEIKYTSKIDAMDDFKKNPEFMGEVKILDENPLPATLDIHLKKKGPEMVKKIAEEIKMFSGVEDIYCTSSEAENLSFINKTFSNLVKWFNLLFIVFAAISVILLTLATTNSSAMQQKSSLLINVILGVVDATIGSGMGFFALYQTHKYVFTQCFKSPIFFNNSEILVTFFILVVVCVMLRISQKVVGVVPWLINA